MKKVLLGLANIMAFIVAVVVSSASVSAALWWFNNTIFINKIDYEWAISQAYRDGKYNERLCKVFEKSKETMNSTQEEFCKKHNSLKDHPRSILGL